MSHEQTDDNAGAVSPSESQQAAFSMQHYAQGHEDHEQRRAVPAVHGQSDDCIEMRRLHRFLERPKPSRTFLSVSSVGMYLATLDQMAQGRPLPCVSWLLWICQVMVMCSSMVSLV